MKIYNRSFNWFLYPYILFVVAGALVIAFTAKGDIVMLINKYSTPSLDSFFLFVTNIGLGSFVAITGALFLFYKIRWGLFTLINLLWVGIFTNLLKRVLFPNLPRPFHHFYYDDFHRFIYDAPLIYYSSFPSGHTVAIFGFCSVLAYLLKNKALSFTFFILAFLVGMSRIYLLQHFFIDVYAGSVLGVISLIISAWIIDKKLSKYKNGFLDKGLVYFVRKKNQE